MSEDQLFSGTPEPTSLAYAVSKMAGMQLCLAYNQQYGGNRFIPVIPNSVYGPNDNFDPDKGHVLSALIRCFHHAKTTGADNVVLWEAVHRSANSSMQTILRMPARCYLKLTRPACSCL